MSTMNLNIPLDGSENHRAITSSKNVLSAQPRSALVEIGNLERGNFGNKKNGVNNKVKPSNFGKPAHNSAIVQFIKVVPAGKQDLVSKKSEPSPSKYGIKDKEKLIPAASFKVHTTAGNKSELVPISRSQNRIHDIDEDDQHDIFLLGIYVCDIYQYLLDLEVKLPIKPDFLFGTSVTSNMRATIIDWLLDVQMHCSFLLETLHLTVSIIDRFLQASGVVQKKNFQLVGITSMLLACKFEETCYPGIDDFIYFTDNSYTKQQVLDLERVIVKTLDFRLGRPISLTFLRRYSKIIQADQILYTMGKYFIELALLELSLASARPSKVAAAAIFIALCIKANDVNKDLWTPSLQYYSAYALQDFLKITTKLVAAIQEAPNSKYKGIRNKYSKSEFLAVSVSNGVHPGSAVLRKLCKLTSV